MLPAFKVDALPLPPCWYSYGGDDCSKATAQLAFGTPVEHGLRSFEYDYYSLPPPTGGWRQGHGHCFS